MVMTVKAIVPKRFDARALEKALQDEVGKVGANIVKDFEKTVQTWRKKPNFEILTDFQRGEITLLVGTDNEVYRFVDEGTDPHVILPKRAKALRFQAGYTPKTTPRVIGSGSGGAFGSAVYSKGVLHPGTQAREFSKTIADKWAKEFPGRMQNALDKGARKSGHSI